MSTPNIDSLRKQINALYDKAEDKTTIAELTTLNSTIDAVEKDFEKVDTEYKEIFKDYKEMIKHTSVTPKASIEDPRDSSTQAPQFQDFFKTLQNNICE